MGKSIPILLVVFGVLVGGISGYFLKPSSDVKTKEDDHQGASLIPTKRDESATKETAFVKLSNQFVVPILSDSSVEALVVLSVTLETTPSETDKLYSIEPKIRDASLRVLFDHAYTGGFSGHFTTPFKLEPLRKSLYEAINLIAGGIVEDVLITDIIRQDS